MVTLIHSWASRILYFALCRSKNCGKSLTSGAWSNRTNVNLEPQTWRQAPCHVTFAVRGKCRKTSILRSLLKILSIRYFFGNLKKPRPESLTAGSSYCHTNVKCKLPTRLQDRGHVTSTVCCLPLTMKNLMRKISIIFYSEIFWFIAEHLRTRSSFFKAELSRAPAEHDG